MKSKAIICMFFGLCIYGIVSSFIFYSSFLNKNPSSISLSQFLMENEMNATTSTILNQSLELRIEKTTLEYNKYPEYYCLRKKAVFEENDYLKFWKYKAYSKCKTATNDQIAFNQLEFTVKCQNEQNPNYYYDPGEPELLFKRGSIPVKWVNEKRGIGSSQFILIKCGQKSIYTRVFFKYNQQVVSKAERIRKEINSSSKPFTVALLVFDSVSMLSAQNNLPKSWNFLTTAPNVFRFDYAKSFSSTTRANMIPVFYGMNLTYQETLVGGSNMKDQKIYPKQKQLQEKHAIWKHFSSLGYVTYFGYDSAFDFLAKSLGTEILTDHKFINFYKVSNSVYKFTDMTANQRCAGDQGGHKPLLDHTLKYYSTYKGILKFGYTHISSAHEDTGNIRTVDEDLLEFLKDFFKLYSTTQEDFVLFVMGDHGRMNNLLRFDNRGYLDVLNPMMFVAASEGVKDLSILKKNTERLIGRFDLHLTLKDLASFPFGGISSDEYKQLKNFYSVNDVVSLLREEIQNYRSCEDIGSDSEKCGCIDFRSIDMNETLNSIIVEEIIKFVNNQLYEDSKYVIECEKPIFHSIINAKVFEIKNFEDKKEFVYKISYLVQHRISVDAEVYFWKEKGDKFWLTKKDKQLEEFLKTSKKPNKHVFINAQPATILLWDFNLSSPCQHSNCICLKTNSK